jgi:hypothetical protein
MERSDAVTDILDRIMKLMERSSDSSLNGASLFEGSDRTLEARPSPFRRQSYGRGRKAHSNHDFPRRKPRFIDSDNLAPTAHDAPLGVQH